VKQTNFRIVYRPDLVISPGQARAARARAWKFVFTCASRKQAGIAGDHHSESDGEVSDVVGKGARDHETIGATDKTVAAQSARER
jgi:hypothetical protein